MTELRAYVEPTRRKDLLGVHSLDHFSLAVPSLRVAQHFYGSFGLDVREAGNGLDLHTFGNSQRWASLGESGQKTLSYLSFGIFPEDQESFIRHLDANGIKRLDPPPGVAGNGIWLRDCNGLLLEIKVAQKRSPDIKPVYPLEASAHGIQAAPYRGEAATVRPHRLAHVLVFARDIQESVNFYSRILGLRLSDEAGGVLAFMHAVHGSDHHVVAFAKSSAPGLHHCSWDVGTVNDVGQGAMQMVDKGFTEGWGLGRFVLGSNFFHYVRDPWGSYSEYVSDLDYVPVNFDHEGKSHPIEKASFLWGPVMPKGFTVNYEVQNR